MNVGKRGQKLMWISMMKWRCREMWRRMTLFVMLFPGDRAIFASHVPAKHRDGGGANELALEPLEPPICSRTVWNSWPNCQDRSMSRLNS